MPDRKFEKIQVKSLIFVLCNLSLSTQFQVVGITNSVCFTGRLKASSNNTFIFVFCEICLAVNRHSLSLIGNKWLFGGQIFKMWSKLRRKCSTNHYKDFCHEFDMHDLLVCLPKKYQLKSLKFRNPHQQPTHLGQYSHSPAWVQKKVYSVQSFGPIATNLQTIQNSFSWVVL